MTQPGAMLWGVGTMALVVGLASCTAPEAPPCPTGQLLDETGEEPVCVPDACGIGAWGNELDADLFVDAGADDGDGSQERPFRRIQDAADAMGSDGGGVVAIAGGTYVENLALDADHDRVVLAGRCAELVTIDGSGDEEPGIEVRGGSLEVRGVTVTEGVWGIAVIRPGGPAGPVSLALGSSVLEGNREVGLLVSGVGATVEVVGATTVRETAPNADGNLGVGVYLVSGASLDATDLLLDANHDSGLVGFDPGTTVVLSGVVVRGTRTRDDGTGGHGVAVQTGTSLDATDLLLEANHEVGLFASDQGTIVVLSGAVVRDTHPLSDGTTGVGVYVQGGASLNATDLHLEGNHDTGLDATGAGTSVVLSGASVRDTQPRPDGTGGLGVVVQAGASVDATDLLLQPQRFTGVPA